MCLGITKLYGLIPRSNSFQIDTNYATMSRKSDFDISQIKSDSKPRGRRRKFESIERDDPTEK